ncbi:unnamed protein product [Ectocarpus sp. 4 AP-2014]
MGGGTGSVVQPPETHNVFLCLSVFVGLLWIINSSRRCWAVVQLRRALGSRRLVAIRGAGRRVRIFRLLGRNYLQRALGRNHLQALVHTRQAYPPKTMPCSLLVASDPGGVKAILHPRDSGDDIPVDPPPPPRSSSSRPAAAAAAGALGARADAGPPVGVSVVLDCRVACTVELLWDVNLTLLGREMGLHPKLHLLPASTGAGGSRGSANGSSSSSSQTAAGAAAASSSPADRLEVGGGGNNTRQDVGGSGGLSSLSSLPGNAWASAVSASRMLFRAGRERWGSRVAGAPPESSSRPSGSRGPGRRGGGSGGGGDFGDGSGYPSNVVDEEMGGLGIGGALGGGGAAEATAAGGRRQGSGGADDNPGATAAEAVLASLDGSGARPAGTGNGGSGGAGRSWAASLGLRKSSVFNAGGGDGSDAAGAGGTVGQTLGFGGGSGGRGRGTGGPGVGIMGLCGKRTVPRALSAGGGRVFTTLPGESYFRGRQQSGEWNAGATATSVAGAAKTGGGRGGGVDGRTTAAVSAFGGGAAGGGGAGERRPAAGGRDWPRVGDSVRAGRCSLAIVIRPAAGGETGDWAGWRHRPTHRVTRQVLLVQLTERSAGADGAPSQQAPSARCLRHLVAMSKGGHGDPESIYSFAEVFGASDEAGGVARPGLASNIGSIQATVDGGSSSTVGTASNTNNAGSSVVSGGGGGSSNPAQASQGAGAGGPGAGEEVPEECVICLTDPKNTLLLPCRHLCVCTECFRHVDKCPVCRSAFDNYIVLSAPSQQPQAAAAAATGAAGAAGAAAPGSVAVALASGGGGGGGGEAAAASTSGTGDAGASPASGRTPATVPLALPTGEGNPAAGSSTPPSNMPTGVASMIPSASSRGAGGRREREGGGGGQPSSSSSSPAAAAAAGGGNAVPVRRTIFAVSRRRVPEG